MVQPQWDEESHGDEFEQDASSHPTWQVIRRFFFRTPSERRAEQGQRMRHLTRAIAEQPQAAANYLLRGELHEALQQYALAREDFDQALRQAQAQYTEAAWGLAAQAIQDRAQQGLERIAQYSKHLNGS